MKLKEFGPLAPPLRSVNEKHNYHIGGSRGGVRDARPPWASKFFRFHAVFGKIWRVHTPPWRVHAPPRENPGSATVPNATYLISLLLFQPWIPTYAFLWLLSRDFSKMANSGSRISQTGKLRGGCKPIILANFPEKCIINEIKDRGGGVVHLPNFLKTAWKLKTNWAGGRAP